MMLVHNPWAAPVRSEPTKQTGGFVSAGVAALAATGPALRVARHGFAREALALVAIASIFGLAIHFTRRSPVVGAAISAALAVGAAVWSADSIGRSVILATIALVAASHAALLGRAAWRSDATPQASIPGAACTAAASVTWGFTGSLALFATLVLAAYGVVALGTAEARTERWNDTIVRRARVAGDGLAVLLCGFAASLLLYPFGVVASLGPRLRRRTAQFTTWVSPASAAGPAVTARRMYAGTDRKTAIVRNGFAVISIAAIAAGIFWDRAPSLLAHPSPAGVEAKALPRLADPETASVEPGATGASIFAPEPDMKLSDLAAYQDAPWADELQAEHDRFVSALPVDDTTGHRNGDFSGVYTQVAHGERRSLAAPECACRAAEVWFFGGSAAFGLGHRGDHTVASELVRVAQRDGFSLTVRNFGVPGWTRADAVTSLLARLGEQANPDLVVFYDGFNDVIAAFAEFVVEGISASGTSTFEALGSAEFGTLVLTPESLPDRIEAGAAIAQRLKAQRARLADATSVQIAEFFQPDALASPLQFDAVKTYYKSRSLNWFLEYLHDLFARTAKLGADDQTDLRSVFDAEASPLFSNLVHTNERGAAVAAEAIWVNIRPRLRDG